MSETETKNPLPTILVGVVVVFIALLGSYAVMAMVIGQINPKRTKKLLRKHQCKVAYKALASAKDGAAPEGVKWASKFMPKAAAAEAACLAGPTAKRAPASRTPKVAKAAARRPAPAKAADPKAPAKAADGRPAPAKAAPPARPADARAPAAAPKVAKAAARPSPKKAKKAVAKAAKDAKATKAGKKKKAGRQCAPPPRRRKAKKPAKPLTPEQKKKKLAAKCKRAKMAAFIGACASGK